MASLLDFFTGSGSFGGQQLPNSPEAASQGYAPNIFDRFGTGLDRLQQYPGLPAMPMDEEERRRQRLLTLAQLGSTVARGGTLAEGLQGVQQQGLQRIITNLQLQRLMQESANKQAIADIVKRAASGQAPMSTVQQVLSQAPVEAATQMPLPGGGAIETTRPNLGPTLTNANLLDQAAPKVKTPQGAFIGPSDIAKISALDPKLAATYASIYNQMSPDIKVAPNGVTYDARDPSNVGKRFPSPTNVRGQIIDVNDPANLNKYFAEYDKGIIPGPQGTAQVIPGYSSSAASIAGAIKGAEKQAQAPYEVVTLPTTSGGSMIMSQADFARRFNPPGIGPTQPTPEQQAPTAVSGQAQQLPAQQVPTMQAPRPVSAQPQITFGAPPSGIGGQTTESKATAEEFTRFFYKDILQPAKANSDAARGERASLQSGLSILNRTPVDKINMNETIKSLSGYAKAAGLLSKEGAKNVTNISTLNSLVQDAVFNKLLAQKGVQTEGDNTRALQTYTGLNDAKAMEFLFRFSIAKGNLNEEYYKFLSNWNSSGKPKNQAEMAWMESGGARSVIKDPVMKPFWPLLTEVRQLNNKKYRIFPDGTFDEIKD